MAAQKIGSFLTARGELGKLSTRVRRLSDLQRVVLESAPPQLARASRVKTLRAGILYLLADNATVAAKLKQLVPRLLSAIQKTEAEVTGIHIQVQVKSATKPTAGGPGKSELSPEIIDEFRKLSDRVADRNLKTALSKLVQRRDRKS